MTDYIYDASGLKENADIITLRTMWRDKVTANHGSGLPTFENALFADGHVAEYESAEHTIGNN